MEGDHTKPRISNNATTYSVPINSWHLPPRHHYFVSQHTVDIQFLPDPYSFGNLEMRTCNSPIQLQEETPNTIISNPENHPGNAHLTSGLRASGCFCHDTCALRIVSGHHLSRPLYDSVQYDLCGTRPSEVIRHDGLSPQTSLDDALST